ncbi:MAG: penicillin-binding protein activator [Pseudomonadota bacterium]
MVSFLSKFRNAIRVVLFGGAIVSLAACDPTLVTAPSTGTGGNSKPVDVALLVPGGSGVGELDAIALSLENAARLAVADLNGVTVNLTVYNTRRDPGTAVNATNQAISDGADIILGPLDGEVAAAVGVAARAANTNVLTFSNNTAVAGGNVFLLGQTFDDGARRVAGYAAQQGRSGVVVVHAQNVAGEAGRAAASSALAQSGLTLAGTSSYENTLPGISAAIPGIRNTVSSSGADSIFLTSNTAGALPILVELLPEGGVNPEETQYLGLARWDLDPRLFTLAGAQGGWFAMPDRARSAAFSNRYVGAYAASPHPLAFTAYDGIAIIGALWAQGGGDPLDSNAITRSQGFQGSTGIVRLRADGTNQRGLAIGSIVNGQITTLEAAPQGFSGSGF